MLAFKANIAVVKQYLLTSAARSVQATVVRLLIAVRRLACSRTAVGKSL